MALGDDLRADDQVDLALLDRVRDGGGAAGPGRVSLASTTPARVREAARRLLR